MDMNNTDKAVERMIEDGLFLGTCTDKEILEYQVEVQKILLKYQKMEEALEHYAETADSVHCLAATAQDALDYDPLV